MELKPCPFCGNSATFKPFNMLDAKWFYVKCEKCSAEINNPVPHEKEAVEAWNRRVNDEAVPVVHGRWMNIPDKPEWDQKMCSVCGDYFCCQVNYCPNCGAKMDGERRDDDA